MFDIFAWIGAIFVAYVLFTVASGKFTFNLNVHHHHSYEGTPPPTKDETELQKALEEYERAQEEAQQNANDILSAYQQATEHILGGDK